MSSKKKKLVTNKHIKTEQPTLVDKGLYAVLNPTLTQLEKADKASKTTLPQEGIIPLSKKVVHPPMESKNKRMSRIVPAMTILARTAELGMGASMLMNYSPIVGSSFGKTLYHGSIAPNAPSVLSRGILTSYAGQQKRLNSSMMTSAIRDNLSGALGRTLTKDEKNKIINAYRDFKPGQGQGVVDTLISTAKNIAKKNHVPHDKIKDLEKGLETKGKRIYFGYGPHTVLEWGGGKNEAQMAIKKMTETVEKNAPKGSNVVGEAKDQFVNQIKSMGKLMFHIGTGGIVPVAKETIVDPIRFAAKMRKVPTLKMTRSEAIKHIQKNFAGTIKGAPKYGVVYGVKLKPKELKHIGAFADFPVVGDFVASNVGLRNQVKSILPNYTPARDISVPNNISPESIKNLIITHAETNKPIQKIEIIGEKAPKMNFFKHLRTVSPKAALITAGGVALGLDALFGTKWLKDIIHKRRESKKRQRNFKIKTAAMSPEASKALKSAFKWGGLTTLGAAALGAPYAILHSKGSRKSKEIGALENATAQNAGALETVGGLAGTLAPDVALHSTNRDIVAAEGLFGGAGGAYAGMVSGAMANPVEIYQRSKFGLTTTPLNVVATKKENNWVKRNAPALIVGSKVLGAGTAVGATKYLWDRYYSDPIKANMSRDGGVLGLTAKDVEDISKHVTKNKRMRIYAAITAAVPLIGAGILLAKHKQMENALDKRLGKVKRIREKQKKESAKLFKNKKMGVL